MAKALLETIDSPSDLKKLNKDSLPRLSKELREFIIDIVSVKQGHLGSSLGVVELTIALHYFFDTPDDLLIWDVGHQAYGHKILTGRRKMFDTNRQLNGISGFPNMKESSYDAFGTGHSSTSISAAMGMAIASKLKGDNKRHHIAVIGDASITSGMSFEALNHAGASDVNLWVILNDNSMGIDPSVGALKDFFINLKDNNPLMEAFNFTCQGSIDGHDFKSLFDAFNKLREVKGPKFLHVRTVKGKGLIEAERNQTLYHSPGKFNKSTGVISSVKKPHTASKYQDVFGKTILELARDNSKIIGITPAMPTGSSLKYMMEEFPKRAFDVGIAEQHGLTFAAGLAAQGYLPYYTIYSTFLQRAYDQLIHDVALQKLVVVFCVDRAGIVGGDGATHHGLFDLAFLRAIPNMIVAAPRDEVFLRQLLYTAQFLKMPIAIRYPRGLGHIVDWQKPFRKVPIGKGMVLKTGLKLVVISIGTVSYKVSKAIETYAKSELIGHIDMLFLKPIDEDLLHDVMKKYSHIITVEEGVIKGGLGSAISEFAHQNRYSIKIKNLGIPDCFITHGSTDELLAVCGIDSKAILETIRDFILR